MLGEFRCGNGGFLCGAGQASAWQWWCGNGPFRVAVGHSNVAVGCGWGRSWGVAAWQSERGSVAVVRAW